MRMYNMILRNLKSERDRLNICYISPSIRNYIIYKLYIWKV